MVAVVDEGLTCQSGNFLNVFRSNIMTCSQVIFLGSRECALVRFQYFDFTPALASQLFRCSQIVCGDACPVGQIHPLLGRGV